MKIYTKKGDNGFTSLYGTSNIPKSSTRIQAYGKVDEVNSYLGLLISLLHQSSSKKIQSYIKENQEDIQFLYEIQNNLFCIGGELATIKVQLLKDIPLIQISDVDLIEKNIDQLSKILPQMKNFILPGGSILSSHSHTLRTICREAERHICFLNQKEPIRAILIQYMNRLSDFFFTAARFYNKIKGDTDIFWIPKK